MIQSMTGYGRGECLKNGISAVVELRSVNSRFFELGTRLPRSLALRENEIKEIVRSKVVRGKISLTTSLQSDANGKVPLKVNTAAAQSYYKLLSQLRKSLKLKEKVKLEHLLRFSEVFEGGEDEEEASAEWEAFEGALQLAVKELQSMRAKEGGEISKDIIDRVEDIQRRLESIESISKERIPEERSRLHERIGQLLGDKFPVDAQRLELEIALLADKLDVTEECVRFRSHNKFFLEALRNGDAAGRKLNFLIQEMNREANTVGSKSNDTAIAHHVIAIKEELEKIREQLQNIE
ncbi:MAG TPA: YicC/YloC family endoribonuclease [Bacteroidota bacterium]|nr:YicC/YloC family endoribonuclease [Bacteroidota bacterium]